jgi:hypothetical protein
MATVTSTPAKPGAQNPATNFSKRPLAKPGEPAPESRRAFLWRLFDEDIDTPMEKARELWAQQSQDPLVDSTFTSYLTQYRANQARSDQQRTAAAVAQNRRETAVQRAFVRQLVLAGNAPAFAAALERWQKTHKERFYSETTYYKWRNRFEAENSVAAAAGARPPAPAQPDPQHGGSRKWRRQYEFIRQLVVAGEDLPYAEAKQRWIRKHGGKFPLDTSYYKWRAHFRRTQGVPVESNGHVAHATPARPPLAKSQRAQFQPSPASRVEVVSGAGIVTEAMDLLEGHLDDLIQELLTLKSETGFDPQTLIFRLRAARRSAILAAAAYQEEP